MKGRVIPVWRFLRHANNNWNGTTCYDWAKEELKMGQIIWHIYVYC